MSTSKLPETTMCQRCPENRSAFAEAKADKKSYFVNRRILTFRMRPKAARVAMIDDPP